MEIRFYPKAVNRPKLSSALRLKVRTLSVAAPQSLGSFISDPRLFLSSPIQTIEVVEAMGLKDQIKMIKRSDLQHLFLRSEIKLAVNPKTKEEYIVLSEAFEEHKFPIFYQESESALKIIESNHGPDRQGSLLYERAKELVFQKKNKGKNLRHLSFMLREAAEAGADYITATAILVHNLDDQLVKSELLSGKKKRKSILKAVDEVLKTKKISRKMTSVKYFPPPLGKMPVHHIQNFMDSIIKLSEGNGRAILLFLVHQFSSFMRKRKASENVVRAVNELYSPLAERFCLMDLAQKLRNEAFRVEDPKVYYQIENDMFRRLGMSREEAGLFVDAVVLRLRGALAPYNCILAKGRIKKPWEAKQKTELKSENYPEVIFLQDILGVMGVTENALTLEEAIEVATQAAGEDFNNINYSEHQTETKRVKLENNGMIKYHHVSIELSDGNYVEFQFMDRESYEIREKGAKAHFAYRLKQLTGQEFDEEDLEACRALMKGDLSHDVRVVYETLDPWVYVFFDDVRYKERVIRVLRLKKGSIPLDAAHFIIGKDLSGYAGTKMRKKWEARLNQVSEVRHLEDGDFMKLNPLTSLKQYITDKVLEQRLIVLAKDPLTKVLLKYNSDDVRLESDSSQGFIKFKQAAKKAGLKINKIALRDQVERKLRMSLKEFYAAYQSDFISEEAVLQMLAQG